MNQPTPPWPSRIRYLQEILAEVNALDCESLVLALLEREPQLADQGWRRS